MKITADIFTNGRWLQRKTIGDKYTWTVSGVLWNNLKERTTPGSATQLREPSYIGSSNDFKSFDAFVNWNRKQAGYALGYELDSDLLLISNKCYSEETCLLIPPQLNRFLQGNGKEARVTGGFPSGMYSYRGKLHVRCSLKLPDEEEATVSKYFSLDEVTLAKEFYKDCKNDYLQKWINKLKTGMVIDSKVVSCLSRISFDYKEDGINFGWGYSND